MRRPHFGKKFKELAVSTPKFNRTTVNTPRLNMESEDTPRVSRKLILPVSRSTTMTTCASSNDQQLSAYLKMLRVISLSPGSKIIYQDAFEKMVNDQKPPKI